MPITLTPETEAKLIRFATSRGLAPKEALDIALDELLDENEEQEDYQLTAEDIEALRQGAADSDAGRFSDAKANSAERREMILQRQRARAV